MRSFLSVLLCVGLTRVDAQVVMTFEAAGASGLRVSELEQTYNVELGAEETLYCPPMDAHREEMMFREMRYQLADSLKAWGLRWNRTTVIKNRVFFDAEGKLDYYIYSVSPPFASPSERIRFEEHITGFFTAYRLPCVPSTLVARCANITFLSSE